MTNEPTGKVEVPPKETKDLYLAAAMHAEGCEYIGVDKEDPHRMIFKFVGGDNPDRVEKEWYQNRLVVSATMYADSIKRMKSIIHN